MARFLLMHKVYQTFYICHRLLVQILQVVGIIGILQTTCQRFGKDGKIFALTFSMSRTKYVSIYHAKSMECKAFY